MSRTSTLSSITPLLSALLLSGCGEEKAVTATPETDSETIQPIEEPEIEVEAEPEKTPPLAQEPITEELLKNALVASSVRIDQNYFSQTGILVNPPNTTSSPTTASGYKTELVLFPHLDLEKQTIGNNAKQLADNTVFSKIVYLSSQTSGPASQFEILKTSSRLNERALSISTEPPQIKMGMGVTVFSSATKVVPLTAAEEKQRKAKSDLTELRVEIKQFLKEIEQKAEQEVDELPKLQREFTLSRRRPPYSRARTGDSYLSLWDKETKFLETPPSALDADQYKEYRDLKNRLIASRNLIPRSDPMMGPQYGGRAALIGSGGSDRPKEWDLVQFKSEVIGVSDEGDHVVIAAGPDRLPDALGFVVLGDNGHLLGLASRDETGNLQLHSFEHLTGLNKPSVESAEISISVSDKNLVTPKVKPKTRLGLDGWESMWIAMVPTEEKVSFPAGDGADAIFNPTNKPSNLHTEKLLQNYESKIEYEGKVNIQPGTKLSFTGQFFAKSSGGNEFYFDPFTFEVESAADASTFDIKMVSGPAYASVSDRNASSQSSDEGTEELMENGSPAVIDFEGGLLASHLNGSRDILTIQTNAPPFIQTVDLKIQTKVALNFEIADADSKLLTAVSGNNLYVINPKTKTAQKFDLTTGKLLSKSEITNFDGPVVAIAAASSNATSPLMICSSHRIGLFSPNDFEKLSPTLSANKSKDIVQDNNIHIPQPDNLDDDDTLSYSAEISADGLSYLFISSKNSRKETTIFMQPNANHSAFSLTESEVSDDLGFNGYMLRKQSSVKTGIDGKWTRIKSKHTLSVSNKGGEGYFSINPSSFQRTGDYPAPPATLSLYYLGNKSPVFSSNLFPELKFFTRDNTTGKNVIFNQATDQLITIPNIGGQLFIRNLSENISNKGGFLFTTSKNISIERGEKLEILISTIGDSESIEKVGGPSNSTFNPESSLFTWDIPKDYSKDKTEVVFNAKIADGSTVEHRIEIDLTGTPPAVITRGLPYDSKKRAPNFDADLPQFGEAGLGIPLDSEYSKFIPTASGNKAVVTYFDTPRIDLIDLSKGEISASATLSSDVSMVTANHEAIFCYYPFHQIIERRNSLTLEIEKTAILKLKAPLRVFKTGYQSRDSAPIIGISDTSNTRKKDHQFIFINPIELTSEVPTGGTESLTRNMHRVLDSPISVSEKGDRFMFGNQIHQINGTVTTKLLELQSAHNSGDASISSHVDAVFINQQQYLIPSSSKIDRKIRDLDHFNFSSSGEYVFGYGLDVTSKEGRKALIEFFEPFQADPFVSIYRLPELERQPKLRPQWDDRKYNRLVYHFESINKLITLPRDRRTIVIRDLNLPEVIKKLK